jgi:4-amino-4-deoxy-L-arabinose transferase-like glycosyltransferase
LGYSTDSQEEARTMAASSGPVPFGSAPRLRTGGVRVTGALARALRGPRVDPAWLRPGFLAVGALTVVLYIWGLDRSGYANQYYSAAVLAATRSWKAFFFGSLDAGNFITVDKPPLALWLMDLSARLFGVSSWSILLPEALAGVATMALTFRLARRLFGPAPGLIAAAVMATTPVAVVMFRYNNPDALLTLFLLASAWALLRALETDHARWLMLSAALVGLGFNTKYLQAYILLPVLAGVVLVAGPGGIGHRVRQCLRALPVLVVSSGWWVAIVALVPAASRPFIGGSTDNSVLNLVFGYDGFGRVFGQGPPAGAAAGGALGAPGGALGGPGGAAGFAGAPGLLRVFNTQIGGEVSWLVPAALVALAAGLWLRRRAPRTDLARAGYLLFGGWLLIHLAVFDFAGGILHPYYAVVLAPAIGAVVGAGAVDLWRARQSVAARLVMAVTVAGTAWWAAQVLGRTPDFVPWLAGATVVAGGLSAVTLLLPSASRSLRLLAGGAAVGAAAAVMAGPAAYAVASAGRTYGGGDPSAGPAVMAAAPGQAGPGGAFGPPPGPGFAPPPGQLPPGALPAGPPPGALPAGPPPGVGGRGLPAGTVGAPGGAVDSAMVSYLTAHRGGTTWLLATSSSMEAAGIQLATGEPVMAMGGFSGSDPAMSVDRLMALVAAGRLRYVLIAGPGLPSGGVPGGPGAAVGAGGAGPRGAGPGGGNTAVSDWVQAHGSAVSYGGSGSGGILYDLAGG